MVKMVSFPFKNKNQERAGGLVIALFGLIILALGISNPELAIKIWKIDINFISVGFVSFFIGLFYLLESMLYPIEEDKIKKIMEEIRELRNKVNKGEIDLSEYEKMANEF
ncbi:MAG: hypothetical protein ACTSR2_01585 [Candidatus Hodarchaeales archaeon]